MIINVSDLDLLITMNLTTKKYFEKVINYSHLLTKKCLNKFKFFQINIKLNLLNFYLSFLVLILVLVFYL